MNKVIILISVFTLVFLSGCGLREKLLAPPEETEVPKGSLFAECTKGEDIYKFVYQDDGVYLYYINDIEQNEDEIDNLIEQAYLTGSSVDNYLSAEFPEACLFSEYESD